MTLPTSKRAIEQMRRVLERQGGPPRSWQEASKDRFWWVDKGRTDKRPKG